jgi:hypothetical protein
MEAASAIEAFAKVFAEAHGSGKWRGKNDGGPAFLCREYRTPRLKRQMIPLADVSTQQI